MELLTPKEAANLLKCTENHIRELCKEKRISAMDIARKNSARSLWRIPKNEIEKLLAPSAPVEKVTVSGSFVEQWKAISKQNHL